MKRPLRSIAPALPASERTLLTPAESQESGQSKRSRRDIACNRCRIRKNACDGVRPKCGACLKHGSECVFRSVRVDNDTTLTRMVESLQKQVQNQQELLDHLQSLPEAEAVNALLSLRSASDPANVLSSIQGCVYSTMRPSDLSTARVILPQTDSAIEFELMARHPTAYARLLPTDVASLENFLKDSTGYQAPVPSFTGLIQDTPTSSTEQPDPAATAPNKLLLPFTGDPSRPSAMEYCDSRLHRLQISYWTNVDMSNSFAATLISLYLTTDHAVFGFFDADLFLGDLVARRLDFCSSFLVAALLSFASLAYTSIDPDAAAVSAPAFFREAELLWRGSAGTDTIVTVSALGLFTVAAIWSGNEALGLETSAAGRRMARKLGLFGIPHDSSIATAFREQPSDWIKAASHAAWGTYCAQTLQVLFYHREPISHPPSLPVPGDLADHKNVANAQGLRTWPPHPPPPYVGQTFTMTCKLWTIAHEVAAVYIPNTNATVTERAPLAFAEEKYRKLLSWLDTINHDAARNDHSPGHAIIFHMMFHVVVGKIFYPFIWAPQRYRLRSFTSPDAHPKTIFTASVNQLKQLMLRFRSRYLHSICTVIHNAALIMLTGALLRDDKDSQRHLYFQLCLRCWQDLDAGYPICREIVQAYLSMALWNRAISSSQAKGHLAKLKNRGQHRDSAAEAMTTFIADFDLHTGGSGEAQVHKMALEFDDLALFDEFTTGKTSKDDET